MDHSGPAPLQVSTPRAEHHDEPLGIGEPEPRLSWQVTGAVPGWRQAAYEIECADPAGPALRSGRITSGENVLVDWPFPPLDSRSRRTIRVRLWDTEGAATGWSPALTLETGLLTAADWSARFVTPEDHTQNAPLLRTEFVLRPDIAHARLYVTALGLYEIELNGERVGDHTFAPGWTSYHHRLRYQTFDVTTALRTGENALGAWLAEGWYRGRLGFHGGTSAIYGDRLALLAQLEVTYTDGTTDSVGTGPGWRSATGPIRSSGLYDGEHHDARDERPGWSRPGFDDSTWTPVRLLEHDLATLVAPDGPPVRCTQELAASVTSRFASGRRLIDFGQNLVGRLRIRVRGRAGQVVRLRHAEVLQDGELCTRPLRGAAATDSYTLRGGTDEEVWEPRFTFHGFRYAEISGDAEVTDVVARVHHTDMRRTGTFTCSNALLQRLHDNVVWSMRGNFLDVPTDCPQRDERLGWTGDIQVFTPTAAFLYDCAGMLGSWLRDVAAEQKPDGTVPFFVPEIPAPHWTPAFPAAVWGDVAVLTPWDLYQRFGDAGVLRSQYASAKAWIDRVTADAGPDRLWDNGKQLGDWLDPTAPPHDPSDAKADPHLIATAYYARSTRVLAETARVLGHVEEHRHYATLADEIAAAFARRWVQPSGLLDDDAQASYALTIHFGLFPGPAQRAAAGDRLAELVADAGHRIATGFAGTPVICDALTETGHLDTAYELLLQTECPSWLYPVTQGATTIWERWDSLLPDGTVNPGEMTSFNHYALGAVADWLHRTVAGLAPAEPGYRRLLLRPRPGGDLTHAAAEHDTPHGPAALSWRIDEEQLEVEAVVPIGVTATVQLPGRDPFEVASGRHHWSIPWS
ncbi:alpha-L-rhamnosidase [Amycolatopsis pretoriensis]|uniref:alpha-L-rhamnosidase n=1 Tax=Amycolatopsis pretoriensis TaxID=218821 RepID=A0A1H5R1K1_9PSEU|nr:alpha-L-rhamnosidase [Amycolatopsis pretoriensis]SEF32209.1 alpha-L-rhamnosidase [Amycolatopsis pretoriensis]